MSRYAVDLPLLLNIVSGDESKVLKLNEPVRFSKHNYFYFITIMLLLGRFKKD